MSCALIVAELATAHGGDVEVAAEMIRMAANYGADLAKLQTYSLARLNPRDPQAAWLTQAHLDQRAHEHLLTVGQKAGIEVFSTPFDADSLQMLRDLGLTRFKIASSESQRGWWDVRAGERWIVSYPWGIGTPRSHIENHLTAIPLYLTPTSLTAIPLYPTPLEAVSRATLLDGWSDHCEGLSACQWALAHGAQMIEVHVCLPGKSRMTAFDKRADDLWALRRFAEDCATMRSGVSETFRTRWSKSV